jgi:carboxyl-terminal processing protease
MTNRNYDPDYFDGLTPDIEAADDFSHALGDREEVCLKTAIEHIENYTEEP